MTPRQVQDCVIDAAYIVHKSLGCGLVEVSYQRALAYELDRVNLVYIREISEEIFYGQLAESIGVRKADFVVEKKVAVELKSSTHLTDANMAQLASYLMIYKVPLGLLINFGNKSLIYRRL
jgi:GxxExxY protein